MAELLRQLRPELLTLGAALAIILLDLIAPRDNRKWLGWVSGGLAALLVAVVAQEWGRLERPVALLEGAMVADRLGLLFKVIFLLGVAVVAIGSAEFAAERFRSAGEYHALLFFSALGMMLMASSGSLLTLYLGIELTTLSLYVLVAFAKDRPRSGEAGLKYLILGATASAMFIYGTSLVYGSAGTTLFSALFRGPTSLLEISPGLLAGGLLVLAALAFKIAAVPFHMWAPDVYQGAPTPVTAYLSTASKAAGFAALMRVFFGPIGIADTAWVTIVAAVAGMSMIVGNLLAIQQRDIKRMLAYSGIAQAGYGLVGVVAASPLGVLATAFFLFQYLFTNLGAFLIVSIVESPRGPDRSSPERDNEIRSYNGLSRRNPVLALALLLLLLSLAGIPPLGGFWGKLFVFWAGVQSGHYGLVMIGVLASVVSLYYYLMVARAMYIEPVEARPSIRIPTAAGAAVLVCVILVVGLAYPNPILDRAWEASMALAQGWF